MEDWFLRFVGRAFSTPDASEQVTRCEKENRLLAKHIRHRAQARSTRKTRDWLQLLNSLLRSGRAETVDAVSGDSSQDRKQGVDHEPDRLNLAFHQEFLVDRAEFERKE
jgi:hypothetical protein